MELVDVEVDDVEVAGLPAHLVEHQHVIGDGIADGGIEAQGLRAARNEPGRGDGVAAGKQRDVVALLDERLGQVGDDALRSAVEARRHAFHQGRDLCDLHVECIRPFGMKEG